MQNENCNEIKFGFNALVKTWNGRLVIIGFLTALINANAKIRT